MRVPPCPFGAAWEDLRLADVRRFLNANPPERSTWEAKRHDTKSKLARFVREECCAFANRRGGYLLLGAEDLKGSGWKLRGIDVPGVRELHDWFASLLRELSPPPRFDIHEWGLSNGRRVAIVQVEASLTPPVSYGGSVYLRHGTQTIKADGPAIRRLAEQGTRAQRGLETKTRKRTKELAEELYVPFAVGLGRFDERPFALTDTQPEEVAYERLHEGLAKRWRKRKLELLVWGDRKVGFSERLVLGPRGELGYEDWRVAWKMQDTAQHERFTQRLNRPRSARRVRSGSGPDPGDKDIWSVRLDPSGLAVAVHWALPSREDVLAPYGRRAIVNAELLLRVLVAIELDLGADPDEPVFVCLALCNLWGETKTVFVESWAHLSLNARAWRMETEAEASRKMLLDPPADLLDRLSARTA